MRLDRTNGLLARRLGEQDNCIGNAPYAKCGFETAMRGLRKSLLNSTDQRV